MGNEEVTIEEILDKFDLQINTLVDDASLGKTSVDDRSSTISMRGMNFFDGKGRGVNNFQQVLKHNDYATNVDEIKEFLDWAIKYLKIDGMYEKVVHQKKFTIKFFELIKWIYCNKGWLGRPLALKRAFFILCMIPETRTRTTKNSWMDIVLRGFCIRVHKVIRMVIGKAMEKLDLHQIIQKSYLILFETQFILVVWLITIMLVAIMSYAY